MSRPNLSFCVELESPALTALFEKPEVLRFLVEGGHRVILATLDFSQERAAVVRQLEGAGVQVTAWLVVEREHGYWLNTDNASHAVARYAALHAWTRRENLVLPRLGLDIEPPREHHDALLSRPLQGTLTRLAQRRDERVVREAERAYLRLVETARRDGRRVETYQLPWLSDERRSGSTLLRRALGIFDVTADREAMMLYRSYLGGAGIRAYFSDAPQGIVLGVTGGGVHADDDVIEPKISWAALRADLLAAARHTSEIYVFSLEGCVRQGMLPRLASLDWNAPLEEPSRYELEQALRRRQVLQWMLRGEGWLDRWLPARGDQPVPSG